MSQISPPLRIVLAGSILFMAAWFVLLKPGGNEAAPTPTAASTTVTEAPGAAQQAAQTAEQAAAAGAGEAVQPSAPATTVPGATTSAVPADAPVNPVKGAANLVEAGVPEGVARNLDEKVIVLAFVNRAAADDRRVAGAMKKVYRHDGKVWTKTADIEDVSKYAAITRGADVQQSPTVLVVDVHRDTTSLVGYVDSISINQAVVDALLVDGRPVDDSPYLQKLEGACGDLNDRIRDLRDPRNLKEFRAYIGSLSRIADRFYPRIRSAKPPKQYRSLHRQVMALVNADERLFRQFDSFVRTGQLPAAAIDSEVRSLRAKSRRLDLRLAGLGMDDCR